MILSCGRAAARISVRSWAYSGIDANFVAGKAKNVDVYKGASNSDGDSPDQPSPSDISKKLELHKVSHSNPVIHGADPCTTTLQPAKFPLPPLFMSIKQPGLTRNALERLTTVSSSPSSSSSDQHKSQRSTSSASLVPTPPTDGAPPSSPPGMTDGNLQKVISVGDVDGREQRGSQVNDYHPPTPVNRRSSSVHSDKSEDLLGSGPGLKRKSSQRSTPSVKSDSDTEGRPRSLTDKNTASISQKYGVCQKVAIGKGVTSVVRLAHKWDRNEEKLYAIKVIFDGGLFLLSIKCLRS